MVIPLPFELTDAPPLAVALILLGFVALSGMYLVVIVCIVLSPCVKLCNIVFLFIIFHLVKTPFCKKPENYCKSALSV